MNNDTHTAADKKVQDYEIKHRQIAREAASEGFVLLRNEGGLLPLAPERKVALYGAGAVFPVKGGTGSGDVNVRNTVSVWDGMKNAGYAIVNETWLAGYRETYQNARLAWRDDIWKRVDEAKGRMINPLWEVYTSTPFLPPTGEMPEKEDADTAIYVVSRIAGESADRFASKGDYYLTDGENDFLRRLDSLYAHIVLLINTGSLIDLGFTDEYKSIDSILYISQPGMEAGNAVADVLCGKTAPSGKLTDTWAYRYEDYPSSATFSHNNGNVSSEYYSEGLFVGYRYFDTFEVPARYAFGYGLSYTTFQVHFDALTKNDAGFAFTATVTNTGSQYSAKEVVQVYAACPQENGMREYRRLIGFAKTKLLTPGESCRVAIQVPFRALAAYDEALPGWVVNKGSYYFFVGASLSDAQPAAVAQAPDELRLEKTEHICIAQERIDELSPDQDRIAERRRALDILFANMPRVEIGKTDVTCRTVVYRDGCGDASKEIRALVDTLSTEQLICLSTGDVAMGQGSQIGAAGSRVPGSAAQTSPCALEQGLQDLILADGPAGLRLTMEYRMVNGVPAKEPFDKTIENGFLYRGASDEGEHRYQYCTAIPIGTLLAQTWSTETVRRCGNVVAEEMRHFGVEMWLAPGMNIHRNPLCGRNFEYFSEDPVLTGHIAAAMTQGIQSIRGCAATIKHFACNNQEDNRTASNSILSERTLREIYLLGFEIAVKSAKPIAIMTSYNLINGVHAANSYDLCTKLARSEWGFDGLIMTDWGTTNGDQSCTASGCVKAGNDVIMPGQPMDHEGIRKALRDGSLSIDELKRSVCRLAETIKKLKP